MTKRTIPQAPSRPNGFAGRFELRPNALNTWNPGLRAAADEDEADNSISVLDVIGDDMWTGGGVTAKRIAGALRAIGKDEDVVVNINSPGGDYFEGLAIYNTLREHKGKVSVNVLGLAASAASVVAMAGDEIRIARAGFYMVHNVWIAAVGDRNTMADLAKWLEPFDAAAVDIYQARTGQEPKDIAKMLDREAWIGGAEAVETGFADDFLASDSVKEDVEAKLAGLTVRAEKLIDLSLARTFGMPRAKRRETMNQFKTGTPRAADGATQDAGLKFLENLKTFLVELKP